MVSKICSRCSQKSVIPKCLRLLIFEITMFRGELATLGRDTSLQCLNYLWTGWIIAFPPIKQYPVSGRPGSRPEPPGTFPQRSHKAAKVQMGLSTDHCKFKPAHFTQRPTQGPSATFLSPRNRRVWKVLGDKKRLILMMRLTLKKWMKQNKSKKD